MLLFCGIGVPSGWRMHASAPSAKASYLRQSSCKPYCRPIRYTACVRASADAPEVAGKSVSSA
eukprot:2505283-Pyramimonas_sp.AAC.1